MKMPHGRAVFGIIVVLLLGGVSCTSRASADDLLRRSYLDDLVSGRYDAAFRKTTLADAPPLANAALSRKHFEAFWASRPVDSYALKGSWADLASDGRKRAIVVGVRGGKVVIVPHEVDLLLKGGPAPSLSIDGVRVRAKADQRPPRSNSGLGLLDPPKERVYGLQLLPGDHKLTVGPGAATASIEIVLARDEREVAVSLAPSTKGRSAASAEVKNWRLRQCSRSCQVVRCERPSQAVAIQVSRSVDSFAMFDSLFSTLRHASPADGWTIAVRGNGDMGSKRASVLWLIDFSRAGDSDLGRVCWTVA